MEKPFCQASANNQQPLLEQLQRYLTAPATVLEIGSGTGQHAVYFGRHLPHLTWLTSDRNCNHAGINAWLAEAALPNVEPPMTLDVLQPAWPITAADHVFSANTAHIMDWDMVRACFRGVGKLLRSGGRFFLYGPFSYGGRHTSDGNARFDAALRAQDPGMGLRDVESVDALAASVGLVELEDNAMPANNRLLVWRRA
jgi:cyclopropane fatty-acyl-phospholipid synthase-like methyltransferase